MAEPATNLAIAAPNTAQHLDGKRGAILDAARALFARYGYKRTSIDDVAREAGIAKGTVYLYFASKEALYRALSEDLARQALDDAARALADPNRASALTGALQAKYGRFFRLVRMSPHAGELLDSKNKLSADVFEGFDRAYRAALLPLMGEIARPPLDGPRLLALVLSAASGIEASAPDAERFDIALADLVAWTLRA